MCVESNARIPSLYFNFTKINFQNVINYLKNILQKS